MNEFQKELVNPIRSLLTGQYSVRNVARALSFWAYYQAYLEMIEFIKEARIHPGLSYEIARASVLLDTFVDHLHYYAHHHVDPDRQSLLRMDILGDAGELYQWRDAYKNDIGADSKKELSANQALRYWTFKLNRANDYGPITDLRIEGYGLTETSNIPFWYVWDVGSNYSGRAGYPEYTGLHYIERAYMRLPYYIQRANSYLDRFVVHRLSGKMTMIAPFRNGAEWMDVAKRAGYL